MTYDHISIRQFIENNPNVLRFNVFRVSDNYLFKVKEIKENTVVLNTDVNLEISQDDESHMVHPSSYGIDIEEAKIFRFIPSELDKPAISVDFRKEITTRLQPVETWVFGRIIKEKFYPFLPDNRNLDESDLILEITYDYEFDEVTNEVIYRMENLVIYNEKDEIYDQKPQPKIYHEHQGMEEAERRRKNITNKLKNFISKLSGSSEESAQAVQNFISDISLMQSNYVVYGDYSLVDFITNDTTHPILRGNVPGTDMSIKDFLISKLDYLTAENNDPDLYKGSLL